MQQENAATRWLEENAIAVFKALERATRYWSIHDLAVLTAEQDEQGNAIIRAVDPAAYIRIGEREQRDALVGHAILYPYRQPDSQMEDKVHADLTPNRIQVNKWTPEYSVVEHYYFDGQYIIGQLISRQESPIQAICVAGRGESWYHSAKDIAARMMVTHGLALRAIARYENRMRFLPSGVADAVRTTLAGTGQNARVSLQEMTKHIEGLVNPIISMRPDDAPPDFSAEVLDIAPHLEMFQYDLDQFYILAGLPPTSYGIGVGKGESGIAREKAQDAAASRARAYRRDLQGCLPELCAGAGMPATRSSVSWSWVGVRLKTKARGQSARWLGYKRA